MAIFRSGLDEITLVELTMGDGVKWQLDATAKLDEIAIEPNDNRTKMILERGCKLMK